MILEICGDLFYALNHKKIREFLNNTCDMIYISQHTRFRYFSNRQAEKTQMSLHKPAVMLEPLLCTYAWKLMKALTKKINFLH